jgi:YD repeat-containing protein
MNTRVAWRRRVLICVCIAVSAGLLSPSTSIRGAFGQESSVGPAIAPGQTATLMPDGRWLVLGGWRPDGSPIPPTLIDPQRNVASSTPAGLLRPRVGHTTTLLADGSLLIAGGVGRHGEAVSLIERLDLAAGRFDVATGNPDLRRAWHTATLLSDGRVLFAGGTSADGQPLSDAIIWDPSAAAETGAIDRSTIELLGPRARHHARLLADGRVRLSGSTGPSNSGQQDEILDPVSGVSTPAGLDETPADLHLAAIDPQPGAAGVRPDVRINVRFSTPVQVRSVSDRTVRLLDEGRNSIAIERVPAEGGMLLFVRPLAPLEQGRTYTLALEGITATSSGTLAPISVSFTIEGDNSEPGRPIDDELWVPDPGSVEGWSTRRAPSPWQRLPPLKAAAGVTAVAGQLLRLNGQPLAGATLRIGEARATSDQTGRFLVESTPSGRQELVIDGRTASTPGRSYGVFRVGIDVKAGETYALPYTSWMPRIDTQNIVTIPSPTTSDIVLRTPAIPGLEVTLPAGTVIRDIDRKPAREVSITPIPVDRPPFPLPTGVDVPIYFTIQPGGAYLESVSSGWPAGARIVYPNYRSRRPDTQVDFWHYDPEDRGWFVYGAGTVTPDGRRIEPGPGVAVYEFTGAMVGDPSFGPPEGPPPCNACEDGDPVDLATGLFVYSKTDLALPDVLPIQLSRTYRPRDTRMRAFGVGATHPYDIFIVGSTNPWTYAQIVLPDGARIHYPRISPGTNFSDAIFEHTATPSRFYGSRILWNGGTGMWDLRFLDGTVYEFPDAEFATTPAQAALRGVIDRFGNKLTLSRDSFSRLTRIRSPNGRSIDFTYDGFDRITQARDHVSRTVGYEYDASGRLWKVTDPEQGVTEFTYDSSARMTTVKDPRGIVYLTNQYDLSGRVIKQTQADGRCTGSRTPRTAAVW